MAERVTLVPLGDELVPAADPAAPWPGRIPDPAPAVVLDTPVIVLDDEEETPPGSPYPPLRSSSE